MRILCNKGNKNVHYKNFWDISTRIFISGFLNLIQVREMIRYFKIVLCIWINEITVMFNSRLTELRTNFVKYIIALVFAFLWTVLLENKRSDNC